MDVVRNLFRDIQLHQVLSVGLHEQLKESWRAEKTVTSLSALTRVNLRFRMLGQEIAC